MLVKNNGVVFFVFKDFMHGYCDELLVSHVRMERVSDVPGLVMMYGLCCGILVCLGRINAY